MKHSDKLAIIVFSLIQNDAVSFATLQMHQRYATVFRASQRLTDEELFGGFFDMRQIPTATSSSRLDHIVECSESGECNIEDMALMIEELERLNAECLDATGSSRECNLDAVAARNVLKVALASKVILQQKVQDTECDFQTLMNPYSELHHLDDECFNHQQLHSIPTSTSADDRKVIHLDRMVECAEAGDCPVGEIVDMIDGKYSRSRAAITYRC